LEDARPLGVIFIEMGELLDELTELCGRCVEKGEEGFDKVRSGYC
jgi:hypothetical protein